MSQASQLLSIKASQKLLAHFLIFKNRLVDIN